MRDTTVAKEQRGGRLFRRTKANNSHLKAADTALYGAKQKRRNRLAR